MKRLARALIRALRRPVGAAVERRLGGYRQRFDTLDPSLPRRLDVSRSAAIVGGGLAGIAAAEALADRGWRVTLIERAPRVGGKMGGERVFVAGAEREVDHGFHAYFRHYYNLDAFLTRAGVRSAMVPIDDYAILDRELRTWSFGDVATTPGLNLLDLAGKSVYGLREVAPEQTRTRMNAFLAYDRDVTFADLDDVSFADWAEEANLPARLRRILVIFARSFFADSSRLSTAEVVKAFHYYYLSHDHGLLFDHPATPAADVVGAIEAHLRGRGVELRVGHEVAAIEPRGGQIAVDGECFDDVVLATPVRAARSLALSCPAFEAACPTTTRQLAAMEDGARYAVLRLWVDRELRRDLPVFVTIERQRLLDSVASYHRITPEDAEWARANRGSVLELHSYAVPAEMDTDEKVREALVREVVQFLPELEGMRVVDQVLRVRDDFTALHVGMASGRPVTDTEHPHMKLAGDWVALPVPAMLMEGAFTSGLLAASSIARAAGLQGVPIETVPTRGVLAAAAAAGSPRP